MRITSINSLNHSYLEIPSPSLKTPIHHTPKRGAPLSHRQIKWPAADIYETLGHQGRQKRRDKVPEYPNIFSSTHTHIHTMAVAPTRLQVLALYKQFIKNSKQFNNYNFREYFLRRSRESFRANVALQKPEEVARAFADAKEELGVLKRQAIISQMYTFDKLVVEPLDSQKHTPSPTGV